VRHTPKYLMNDPDEVKRLIRSAPWAKFVSATSSGLVASHYPVLLDETDAGITIRPTLMPGEPVLRTCSRASARGTCSVRFCR
jgi:predicted FMN-binding regulatory protein PaiB